MDYIKKYFTFKGIVSTTVVAVAACGLVAVASTGNTQENSQNVSSITEETSSDDGSAPGQCLMVSNSNFELVQSATIPFEMEKETETETQKEETENNIKETFLAADTDETVTEITTTVTVNQEETVKPTEKPAEQPTEQSTEQTTERPSASAKGNESKMVAESEYVINFSEEDYQVLCTIVEAEAGDQDAKGRILVANVIINRVKSSSFPNTIKEVVFQNNGKTYQFSPTKPGGRYYRVTASELTIQCVDRALKGEDYSQGAIYFAMKTSSNSWFNRCLNLLFVHGDHYFYK